MRKKNFKSQKDPKVVICPLPSTMALSHCAAILEYSFRVREKNGRGTTENKPKQEGSIFYVLVVNNGTRIREATPQAVAIGTRT